MTRILQPAGPDDFRAPSKVQAVSIQRKSVGERKGAIKQQGTSAGLQAVQETVQRRKKRKGQFTGESVLEYTKNMSI